MSQRFPGSFIKSVVWEFPIESIEFVLSIPSITNYHSGGPPNFNQKSPLESGLVSLRNQPARIDSLVFKILAQFLRGSSRFIKSFGVSFPLAQK